MTNKKTGVTNQTITPDYKIITTVSEKHLGEKITELYDSNTNFDILRIRLFHNGLYTVEEHIAAGQPTLEGHIFDGVVPSLEILEDRLSHMTRYSPKEILLSEEAHKKGKIYAIFIKM